MRIILFALSVAIISAQKDKKDKKIKRPGKLVGPNDISTTAACFVTCDDPCAESCEVFDNSISQISLGSFDCDCTDQCAHGEEGKAGFVCGIAGINDPSADDTSASCGGTGFDINQLFGRDDCTVNGSTVDCPSTCECEHCDCNPCSEGLNCEMKNGPKGGYQCKQ